MLTPPPEAKLSVIELRSGYWIGEWRWSTEDADFCLVDYVVFMPWTTAEKLAERALLADVEQLQDLSERISRLEEDMRNAAHP